MTRHITLYHSPMSRSCGVHALLEELGADYELHVLNLTAGEQRKAEYLAINPMGKVPAVRHGDALVTEQAAVYLYLADLYADAGLAPSMDDPLRGAYLSWMVFYNACFEPALMDRMLKREPAPPGSSPYGDFDMVFSKLTQQLARGPYLLGERFSAVDVLWGGALKWTTAFKLIPEEPVIAQYIARVSDRPGTARAAAKDAVLAAAQQAAANDKT